MSASTWVVIILLALNLIVSLVVFILGFFMPKGRRAATCLYGIFFFVCPVVGVSMMLVYWLLRFVLRTHSYDSSALSFSTKRTNSVLPPDESTEMNYISIRDALDLDSATSLRRMLLDLLKTRSILDAPNIAHAITSDDVEASHYAATAITSFLSEFRATAQAKLYNVKRLSNNVSATLDAIGYIYPVLKSKIMDDIEQRSYLYILEGLMDETYSGNRWYLTSEHYLNITDLLIDAGEYTLARKWVVRAKECRPNELDTYKCAIHLFYNINSSEELFSTLDELKSSDIVIDKEILDLIRMLNGGN